MKFSVRSVVTVVPYRKVENLTGVLRMLPRTQKKDVDVVIPNLCSYKVLHDRFRNSYLEVSCRRLQEELDIEISYTYERVADTERPDSVFLESSKYVDVKKFESLGKMLRGDREEETFINAVNYARKILSYERVMDFKSGYESVKRGIGVCFHFSHVVIGILRSQGIPSRIVSGLTPFKERTEESHAWVQGYIGKKWMDADPTAGLIGVGNYITWNVGRDEFDVRTKFSGLGKFQLREYHEVRAVRES
ncbi:hypothetical protein HS7_12120 [Sulfolobales archaeon HS-7]|nr:hypothetical protein HS7_12120 [Sulfolobales archaeon HS-7]